MAIKRRLFAAGATLITAAVIGHLVQNGETFYARVTSKPAAKPAVTTAAAMQTASVTPLAAQPTAPARDKPATANAAKIDPAALPSMPRDMAAAKGPAPVAADLPERLAGLDQDYSAPKPGGTQELNQFGMDCSATMKAKPADGAMVHLTLSAPCQVNARVQLYHDIMQFTARTDAIGQLELSVPAFVSDAAFLAMFADGTATSAVATVPDATDYARVALQWQGRNAMQIHAFEFDAEFGGEGHVWSEARGAHKGPGGFLTVLGDASLPEGKVAEIYSYPQGTSATAGVVRLSIEAEVTAANCGREIMAETLQPDEAGKMMPDDLTLFMPSCDAQGEYLVLKNVLQDMKIARN